LGEAQARPVPPSETVADEGVGDAGGPVGIAPPAHDGGQIHERYRRNAQRVDQAAAALAVRSLECRLTRSGHERVVTATRTPAAQARDRARGTLWCTRRANSCAQVEHGGV